LPHYFLTLQNKAIYFLVGNQSILPKRQTSGRFNFIVLLIQLRSEEKVHIPRFVAKGDMVKTCTLLAYLNKISTNTNISEIQLRERKWERGDREDGELEEPLIWRKKLPWEW
jgi:hypothetical protein